MADGVAHGSLLGDLPRAVLPARRRVAIFRELRSDLSEPHDAGLSADGPPSERAVRVVAWPVLRASDANDRRHGAQIYAGSLTPDLYPSLLARPSLHHRLGERAVFHARQRRPRPRSLLA